METSKQGFNFHLAVIHQPYIDMILNGTKTIESRFTKVKCAPYQKASIGDVVYMKEASGDVLGQFTIADVEYYDELNYLFTRELYVKHFNEIFTSDIQMLHDLKGKPRPPEKWVSSRYATLIHIEHVIPYPNPIHFPKRDRRAWVILEDELDAVIAKDGDVVSDRVALANV